MSLTDFSPFTPSSLILTLATLLSLYIAYYATWLLFFDPLRHIPGPFHTRISSIWLSIQCRLYRRSRKVHELHEKYGDIVRIASNHVSINRPEAIQEIYQHHREYRKGPWYQPFETPMPILLTTYDADEHSEQRKNLSPAFSPKALREFEPSMNEIYMSWKRRLLDLLRDDTAVKLNLNEWINYLAFDLIAEFAFGKPFGFVENGEDFLDLITSMDQRGTTVNAFGVLPMWIRPYMPHVPFDSFWRSSVTCILNIRALGKRCYEERIAHGDNNKRDLLSYMLAAKSEGGGPLPPERIIPQMNAMIIAGSDSTAASTGHFIDYVSRDPELQAKVQAEIDSVFPGLPPEDWVPSHSDTQRLTYTNAVIHEVLRLRPTAALGLERCTPNKPTLFEGFTIAPNTLISVPTYSIHRNPAIYPEPETFKPERWLEEDTSMQYKYFNLFSQGQRNCIGQNFAWMEMMKMIVLLFKMFRIERVKNGGSELREGFFLKMRECWVELRRREIDEGKLRG